MEPEDDPQLRGLLREWKVENAPESLNERVLGARRHWWNWAIKGSVLVPAPVAVVFLAVFLAMGVYLVLARTAPPTSTTAPAFNLVDFQPAPDPNIRVVVNRHENH